MPDNCCKHLRLGHGLLDARLVCASGSRQVERLRQTFRSASRAPDLQTRLMPPNEQHRSLQLEQATELAQTVLNSVPSESSLERRTSAEHAGAHQDLTHVAVQLRLAQPLGSHGLDIAAPGLRPFPHPRLQRRRAEELPKGLAEIGHTAHARLPEGRRRELPLLDLRVRPRQRLQPQEHGLRQALVARHDDARRLALREEAAHLEAGHGLRGEVHRPARLQNLDLARGADQLQGGDAHDLKTGPRLHVGVRCDDDLWHRHRIPRAVPRQDVYQQLRELPRDPSRDLRFDLPGHVDLLCRVVKDAHQAVAEQLPRSFRTPGGELPCRGHGDELHDLRRPPSISAATSSAFTPLRESEGVDVGRVLPTVGPPQARHIGRILRPRPDAGGEALPPVCARDRCREDALEHATAQGAFSAGLLRPPARGYSMAQAASEAVNVPHPSSVLTGRPELAPNSFRQRQQHRLALRVDAEDPGRQENETRRCPKFVECTALQVGLEGLLRGVGPGGRRERSRGRGCRVYPLPEQCLARIVRNLIRVDSHPRQARVCEQHLRHEVLPENDVSEAVGQKHGQDEHRRP
mmetsp:Transcript_131712/g.421553  ORF Transcript_131712/g.421553 Transcript_131712/m.421553 type:complete len:576 (-) Transcript_131712:226-1953(-)